MKAIIRLILILLFSASLCHAGILSGIMAGQPAASASYTLQQDLGAALNDYYAVGNTGFTVNLAGSFTANATYTLKQVGIPLKIGGGSPLTSSITCKIYADSGGTGPALGTGLATATNTLAGTISGTFIYYTFQFGGVSLVSGTRYWVVLGTSEDATNYTHWGLYTIGAGEKIYKSSNPTSYWLEAPSEQATMQLYK